MGAHRCRSAGPKRKHAFLPPQESGILSVQRPNSIPGQPASFVAVANEHPKDRQRVAGRNLPFAIFLNTTARPTETPLVPTQGSPALPVLSFEAARLCVPVNPHVESSWATILPHKPKHSHSWRDRRHIRNLFGLFLRAIAEGGQWFIFQNGRSHDSGPASFRLHSLWCGASKHDDLLGRLVGFNCLKHLS